MNKTAFAASIVVASIFAGITPAHAQEDMPFNGPWAGAAAGYDVFTSGDDEDDSSEEGIVYGIALGYDANVRGVVIGAEAELTESGIRASTGDVLEDGDEFTLSVARDIYAGVRIGMPVSDKMMLFAKGGYTNQRFKATYTIDDESETTGESVDGFSLGGGIEFDLGEPFARIEYRYSDYGSFSDADLETNRHQVMLTAGLRF